MSIGELAEARLAVRNAASDRLRSTRESRRVRQQRDHVRVGRIADRGSRLVGEGAEDLPLRRRRSASTSTRATPILLARPWTALHFGSACEIPDDHRAAAWPPLQHGARHRGDAHAVGGFPAYARGRLGSHASRRNTVEASINWMDARDNAIARLLLQCAGTEIEHVGQRPAGGDRLDGLERGLAAAARRRCV